MAKNLPSKTGELSSIPGQETKILHDLGQLEKPKRKKKKKKILWGLRALGYHESNGLKWVGPGTLATKSPNVGLMPLLV